MLHPHTRLEFINADIGYGVFATEPIPRGTITWVLDGLDQVISPRRSRGLGPAYEGLLLKYSYYNGRGDRVLCWDFTRYMNHHCDANIFSPGLPMEIAVRDIATGNELTNDYGSLNLETEFECKCEADVCRGTVGPADFALWAPHWDALIREACGHISTVAQPLWPWVARVAGLRRALARPTRIPSILCNSLDANSDAAQTRIRRLG